MVTASSGSRAYDRGDELFAREGTRSSRAPVGVGVGVAEQQSNIVVLVGATATIADAWVALRQTMFDQIEATSPRDDEQSEPRKTFVTDDTGAREPPPTMTDARGHFELTNLLPGRYQVVAEAQSGKLRGGAADVTTDAQISIRLANVSSLRGTVRASTGRSTSVV